MLTFAYVGGGGAKGSCLRHNILEKNMHNLHNLFQGKVKKKCASPLCIIYVKKLSDIYSYFITMKMGKRSNVIQKNA